MNRLIWFFGCSASGKEKVMSYFNRKSSKKIIMDLYSIYKNYNFENDVIYWSL